MSDTSFIKRSPKRWIFVARLLMILGLLCFLGSTLFYDLLDLPRTPRPSTGNVYPVRNHRTVIYWTEAEVRGSRELTLAAVSCWIGALFIIQRLGLLKRRKEFE
jgi:hypothetical protein